MVKKSNNRSAKNFLEVTKVEELKDGDALVTVAMSNDVADLLIQDALLRGLKRGIKEMEREIKEMRSK